jgi:FkbM family methyltransferase
MVTKLKTPKADEAPPAAAADGGANVVDWKHAALDRKVLQRSLPARAPVARHRAGQAAARERARRFAEASPSYVQALAADEGSAGHATRIELDGLAWWVPLLAPDDPAVVKRYLGHQDFPYRAITQTRELALGGIMLDIGSNNGRMAVPRVILGDAVAAYCAEPDPLNYWCLVHNVRDNGLEGLVMPDRVAIGAENGVVRMLRARTPGGHKVVDASFRSSREIIEVPSTTLDDWCARLGIDLLQVAYVKVDVQGSEMNLLRGASHLLSQRHICWQMEIDVLMLRNSGFGSDDLYGILSRHFTHWIDLNRRARGARLRAIEDLAAGLTYLGGGDDARTDVLLFSLSADTAARL